MNWKKHLLSKLTMGVTIVSMLFAGSTSHAAIASPGKYLKIDNPTYRNSGYAYQVGIETEDHGTKDSLHMWKIYEYNDNNYNTRKTNNDSTFYCLKMGVGFGSDGSSQTHGRNYTKYADMKKPANTTDQDIINAYKQTLAENKDEKYNSLVWLLDNCYIPAKKDAKEEETKAAEEYKKQLLTSANIPETSILFMDAYKEINDDLIDIIQQLAIWHFTNANSQYDTKVITGVQIAQNGQQKATNNYQDIISFFETKQDVREDACWELQNELEQLYTYLINAAENNKSTSSSLTATNPIQLNDEKAKLQNKENCYIAGPYTITEVNKDIVYNVTATLIGADNQPISYTLVKDANGTENETLSLEDLAKSGEQFYLKIENQDATKINNAKFKVTTKIKQNTITYWEVNSSGNTNEQPVAEIKPEEKQFEEETILNLSEFDLALRKFITKVNETELKDANGKYTREPQITQETLEKLAQGEIKTVTKTHTKDPVEVKIGDTVKYTIRIYNEGNVAGYASEVTDYLPTGLTLKAESTINQKYGWQASNDGKTITTDKLKDILIPEFNSTEGIKEGQENNDIKVQKIQAGDNSIYYVDLEIECTVTANLSQATQYFKNVAEITKAEAPTGDNGNRETVTDRDSVPKDLTDNQKEDYKPGHSTEGWGYEDDDDYEDLYIPGKYFDLALRKFITKINNQNVEPSREPEITEQTLKDLQDGKIKTVTKTHTKAPIEVNTDDTILYTIRIYNEGELDGYASEVTDFLPEGLEFVEESDTNKEYGWKVSEDGRTITTDKLKELLIPKFNGTQTTENSSAIKVQKIQKGENTIYYVDLQIECKVVASVTQLAKSMKNVAEITKAEDEYHKPITDRDSIPNDLEQNQKDNYNPGTSEKGWGYEDDDDYEELVLPGRSIDLVLRKFITKINDKELKKEDGTYTREPVIDLSPLQNKTGTTAIYKHPKDPIGVSVGDIVIYTLRIYNEGELDGYASSVTDYLPPQLQFVMDDEEEFNAQYGWIIDSSLRKATTHILERDEIDPEDNLIEAFDGTTLHYKELKIKCRVVSTVDLDKVITNIAEITDFTGENGEKMTDRDSTPDSLTKDNSKPEDQIPNDQLPADSDLPDYKGNTSNKSVLSDENYFYKGQQDDDDFEKLILEEFDLALRKFITKVNETPVTNRVPVFTNVKDENGNYIYEHTKEPVEVDSTDIVEYTLRIYNEGDIAGYAKEVKDDIPNGLEFLPEHETNKEYRWVMFDENGEETDDVTKAVTIRTDYLSKEQEKQPGDNLIEAFDSTKTSPDYKEVKVAFKVIALDSYQGIITNIAEISDDSDENGNPVEDRDSTPDNDKEKEDDIDKEHLKLSYFDLALRKFITGVNNQAVTNRVPQFKVTEDGKYIYEHTKEPVEVQNGDIVTYTLRIYNEGTKDGYAKEVKDDLPDGLEFLPEHETNKTYRWVMLDENGNATDDVTKAVSIKTDYLSKEQEELTGRDNLLEKFDPQTMQEPDYRDIQIAFKVTEPNTSDRILINKAQISDDSDKDGNDVVDKDSTPDRWIEGEDDQDIEKVKVKYFDLALRKWVTEAIVIDNGKETVTQTGHKAEDNPEEVVKVEIKEGRLDKIVVKFRYKIRITNEGEIAGYADEISDYIPEGLKFVAADNPSWKEVDGKIVTDQLKDTLLQPGESAEVEVLLTWINGKNNLGLKVNVAEISKDRNDSHTPDIDSTPNNEKPGEDDIDDAPVILSVKTGIETMTTYIPLIVISLGILSVSVIFIKKYVLL